MSVIAWDGRVLAADTMAGIGDMRVRVSKICRERDEVIAWVGTHSVGMMMREWYLAGADPRAWPEAQKTDDWSRLIVANAGGVIEYEKHPVPQPVLDPYMAFGSGREFAMGALAMGANAVQAVEVAIRHCHSVAGPVEWFEVRGA